MQLPNLTKLQGPPNSPFQPPPAAPGAYLAVHETLSMAEEPPLLAAVGLSVALDPAEPRQVDGVSFELRKGKTFGILGGNECGKTTLADLLLGRSAPDEGTVLFDGEPLRSQARAWWIGYVNALLVLTLAGGLLLGLARPDLLAAALAQGAWSPPLFLLVLRASDWAASRVGSGDKDAGWAPAAMRRRGVAYISSEHDAGQRLPPSVTVEEFIGRQMPLKDRAERRREVLDALHASGFQMFSGETPVGNPEQYLADGLTCEQLSGGQKHLVYVLSVLASRPRLLICDEMLCGLDIDRQSSMLSLLQTMQLEFGTAILFLSVDATSVQLMAHEAAFMRKGKLLEVHRRAHELFEEPRERETRSYLTLSRGNEERSRGKNLRNAYQLGESVFNLPHDAR